MNQLILDLKEAEQDFEFYPTTDEILRKLASDLKKDDLRSFLDVGAGSGKVFSFLQKEGFSCLWYAIERSDILLSKLPENVFVVGTDFNYQTLIDKKVDVIFSNPPYKYYRDWTRKIISEANAGIIYLVIPQRWKEDKRILNNL